MFFLVVGVAMATVIGGVYLAMINLSSFFLAAGLILGVGILATVNQSSLLGFTCYHFGALQTDTFCFNPNVYMGALGVAGALIVVGLALLIRSNGRAARP